MMTDYKPQDRDMAVWTPTTCKAWIASGAIVPPVGERPRATWLFLLGMGCLMLMVPAAFVLAMVWGR